MTPRKPLEVTKTPHVRALLDKCIHCGMCLPSCPTYAIYGTEMDSPRGRIALTRALFEGRIPVSATFQNHITLCLACRACEPACPSGVQYGMLSEIVRTAMQKARVPSLAERALRRLVLRDLMPHAGRLRFLAWWARVYETSGVQRLLRTLGVLPENLAAVEALLPRLPARRLRARGVSPAIGPVQGTVALFCGCIQDAFLADVNATTVRVLQRNGYSVHIPMGQTCCGAAQLHLGEQNLALELARRNIDAFPADRFDAIVSNAGGCGAVLREYGRLLEEDPAYREKARAFASKVRDISEFLAEHLHVPPKGMVNARVTYADSCHLRHAQKVVRQPRDLIRRIPGVELVELSLPDRCCGSAGVYNIIHPQTADAVLDAKLADIQGTGADTIVVTNTGCYLQLIAGVRRAGVQAHVLHLVELLDRSYAADREEGS